MGGSSELPQRPRSSTFLLNVETLFVCRARTQRPQGHARRLSNQDRRELLIGELVVLAGAKLDLTNRQAFEFDPGTGGLLETVKLSPLSGSPSTPQ